jgi:hypothetical protein
VFASEWQTGGTPPTACRGSPWQTGREVSHAARLLGAAGVSLYTWTDYELHQRAADAARERLGEPAWTAAREEGRAMSFEQAVEHVLELVTCFVSLPAA